MCPVLCFRFSAKCFIFPIISYKQFMPLPTSAHRTVRAQYVVKRIRAKQQFLYNSCSHLSACRSFSRTPSPLSDDPPTLRYGIFAQKQPSSRQGGVNNVHVDTDQKSSAFIIAKSPEKPTIAQNTSNRSASGKLLLKASRYSYLLKAIRAARQADQNAKPTVVQES
jgi:hypothetical protein